MDQIELNKEATMNGSHTYDAAGNERTDAVTSNAPVVQVNGEAKEVAFDSNLIGPEDNDEEEAEPGKITSGRDTQVTIGDAGGVALGQKRRKKRNKPKSKRGLVGCPTIAEYCARTHFCMVRLHLLDSRSTTSMPR